MAFGCAVAPRYSVLHSERCQSGAKPVLQDFNVVIERGADGMFVASVPSLPGCYTQAPSREEPLRIEVKRRRIWSLWQSRVCAS